MALWLAGQRVTADKQNAQWGKWARTSGTQGVAASTDVQVQYPTAITTNPNITSSGTGPNAWTLAADTGLWLAIAGIRVSATGGLWELSIASGSTTWSAANVRKATSFPDLNGNVSAVIDTTGGAKAVTVNAWHTAGGSLNIVGTLGETTSIDFLRVG